VWAVTATPTIGSSGKPLSHDKDGKVFLNNPPIMLQRFVSKIYELMDWRN